MTQVNVAELMKGKKSNVTLTYEELSLMSAALCTYIQVLKRIHAESPQTRLLLVKMTNEILKIKRNVTGKS